MKGANNPVLLKINGNGDLDMYEVGWAKDASQSKVSIIWIYGKYNQIIRLSYGTKAILSKKDGNALTINRTAYILPGWEKANVNGPLYVMNKAHKGMVLRHCNRTHNGKQARHYIDLAKEELELATK